MIHWLTHIWTKPLGAWTLLDVLGLLACAPVALTLLGIVFLALSAIPAAIREDWRKSARPARFIAILLLVAVVAGWIVSLLRHG